MTTAHRAYKIHSPFRSFILRDESEGLPETVQMQYLNQVMSLLQRTLMKVYGPVELSDKDKANLRRYIEKVIEAKDIIDGKFPDKTYK
ncbi:MAG TPA: hypothetical protein VIR98_02830 [Candidatus Paceibacterota bacterium]|jgi:hypothetical protein